MKTRETEGFGINRGNASAVLIVLARRKESRQMSYLSLPKKIVSEHLVETYKKIEGIVNNGELNSPGLFG